MRNSKLETLELGRDEAWIIIAFRHLHKMATLNQAGLAGKSVFFFDNWDNSEARKTTNTRLFKKNKREVKRDLL